MATTTITVPINNIFQRNCFVYFQCHTHLCRMKTRSANRSRVREGEVQPPEQGFLAVQGGNNARADIHTAAHEGPNNGASEYSLKEGTTPE